MFLVPPVIHFLLFNFAFMISTIAIALFRQKLKLIFELWTVWSLQDGIVRLFAFNVLLSNATQVLPTLQTFVSYDILCIAGLQTRTSISKLSIVNLSRSFCLTTAFIIMFSHHDWIF